MWGETRGGIGDRLMGAAIDPISSHSPFLPSLRVADSVSVTLPKQTQAGPQPPGTSNASADANRECLGKPLEAGSGLRRVARPRRERRPQSRRRFATLSDDWLLRVATKRWLDALISIPSAFVVTPANCLPTLIAPGHPVICVLMKEMVY